MVIYIGNSGFEHEKQENKGAKLMAYHGGGV